MGTYVYCFTRASHPLRVGEALGVGAHAPLLRSVRAHDLTAVVSDAPADLRPKRRDLATHEMVVARLCAAGTILPMRFGTVAPDDEAVRAELRSGAQRYGELLSRIDGHVELNVKGVHREDAVLRDLLQRDRDLFQHNQALRAAGGGSYQDKVAFGERVAAAVHERRARDAQQAIARLEPHASQMRRGPRVDGCFVNVSFLVAHGARQDFDQALAALREDSSAYARLQLHGPLPPYSFARDEAGR